MAVLGLIAALAGTDLYLKEYIDSQKAEEFPRDLPAAKGLIKLYRNHNAGFPFGFLKERRDLVTQIPLALTSALGGALAFLCMRRGRRFEKAGLILAFSGAVSNAAERLGKGYVVDYFSIQKGRLKKVVFNLGDIYILVGSAILVLAQMVKSSDKK